MGAALHWKWFVRGAGGSREEVDPQDAQVDEPDYDFPHAAGISKQPKGSPLDSPVVVFSKLVDKIKREDIYDGLEIYAKPAKAENELYAQLKAFNITNIPHGLIRVTGRLGAGCYGRVDKGVWKKGDKEIEVALKTLNLRGAQDRVKFLQEATLMAQFRHPNVVTLLGVVSKHEPIMLVVELMHKGNLQNHLSSLRTGSEKIHQDELAKLLLSFSTQVALGMQYLSARGFVHRDLAARNILVSKKSICKVADFGMSRDLADENHYISRSDTIPVKWTALEAILFKKFSTASDVWSYGCLLYEMWSLGHVPYETLRNIEVVDFLKAGRRMSPPPGCPRTVYSLMMKCWNPASDQRPKFRELLLSLLSDKDDVLAIPQKALDTHPLAGVLGSPLEAGEGMYRDLKLMFEKKVSKPLPPPPPPRPTAVFKHS